jgi:hypothetical protein
MRPKDTYDAFDEAYSYPTDLDTVLETMGEETIESPNGTDETIAQIFSHAETRTYESPRALHDEFVSLLSDQYIGRKYYDDRGDNVGFEQTRQ